MPKVKVKIDNPDENGIGEIILQGDNVFKGYLNDPEKTNEVLINGWCHTGDIGYIDENGFIFITGRQKDMIVLDNGKKIFPEEIEHVLMDLEYIKDVLVFADNSNGDDDLKLTAKIRINKKEIQDFYTNYHIDFDNDLPIGAYVTNEKDSLVYYKGIDSESSYSLVYGNIKSNSLSLAQFSIGNDIPRLLGKYAIPDIKDTRCKYVAIIPIDCIGRAWYKKFNIPIKRIPFSTLVIFLTIHNGKISHVIFTNNGVAGLIE